MNVITLRQFLLNLVQPLRTSNADEKTVTHLEMLCQDLEHFSDKSVAEFGEFLKRAQDYERQGNWPDRRPPICGQIVDSPSTPEYANRLADFISREVSTDTTVSFEVIEEFERFRNTVGTPQLKEIAQHFGIKEPRGNAQKIFERIFLEVASRKLPDVILQSKAELLKSTVRQSSFNENLSKIEATTSVPDLRKLAKNLGITERVRSRDHAVELIRTHLNSGSASQSEKILEDNRESPAYLGDSEEEKIFRIVEILNSLRKKAEPDDAPYAEIEDELERLGQAMNKEEAILVAERFGVPWKVNTRADALERIHRRVFDMKRARERIEF